MLDVLHLDFDGIEGIYGLNTCEETENFLKIVDKKDILTSCGSDSHGYEDHICLQYHQNQDEVHQVHAASLRVQDELKLQWHYSFLII